MLLIFIYILLLIAFFTGMRSGYIQGRNLLEKSGYAIFGAAFSVLLMNSIIDLFTDFDRQSLIYYSCFWSLGIGFIIGIMGTITNKNKA